MPKLLPIRSLRYALTGDVGSRIAPPYDVLDEEPKRRLLARDPHNIVAIDLPVTPPKTVGPDSAYEAAGELFKRWRSEGVLKADGQVPLTSPRPSSTGCWTARCNTDWV